MNATEDARERDGNGIDETILPMEMDDPAGSIDGAVYRLVTGARH